LGIDQISLEGRTRQTRCRTYQSRDDPTRASPTNSLAKRGGLVTETRPLNLKRDQNILNLRQISKGDRNLVGGKAYHLGLLAKEGISIPKGFCITTQACREILKWKTGKIPTQLPIYRSIIGAYRKLKAHEVAVRSSAVEEDCVNCSWSGVYSTVLSVANEKSFITALLKCINSQNSEFATQLRFSNGGRLTIDLPQMSILVQEMIPAQVSGVLFTCNPINGSKEELVVNAINGLGERLVAGEVNGDNMIMDRQGKLLCQQAESNSVGFNKRELVKLAKLGTQIESFFGRSQDIEFAIVDKKIHILQSRPIPAHSIPGESDLSELDQYLDQEKRNFRHQLKELRNQGLLSNTSAIFSDGNIGELLPTPTPMSFGIFNEIFAGKKGAIVRGRRRLGYQLKDDATLGLFSLIGGQPFFNLEIDAGTFNVGTPILIENVLERVRKNQQLANYPEMGLYAQFLDYMNRESAQGVEPGNKKSQNSGLTPANFTDKMCKHASKTRAYFLQKVEPKMKKKLARWRKVKLSGMSPEELFDQIQNWLKALKDDFCVEFVVIARIGFYFADLIRKQLKRMAGDSFEEVYLILLQGLDESKISIQMGDLQRVKNGELSQKEYLAQYGHLAANELEISQPRLWESDSLSFPADSRNDLLKQREIRIKAELELTSDWLEGGKNVCSIDRFFRDLNYAQKYLSLRETVKFHYTGVYDLIRQALLQLSQRVGLDGKDIFYLYPNELGQLLKNRNPTEAKIKERQKERQLALQLFQEKRVQPVIFEDRLHDLGEKSECFEQNRIKGTPISAGKVEGKIRHIDPNVGDLGKLISEVESGDILVVRSANLGVAPLLRKAAGLIVEVGGVLAHAACQAREAGIPAVVVESAALLIPNGAKVQLNGTTGLVKL
jgi:pyruvate,water dikinase